MMMIRRSILILFFLFTSYSSIFSQLLSKQSEQTIVLQAADPDNSCISIRNTGDSTALFLFRLNGKFFSSSNDIIDEIKVMAGSEQDSLFYYAWKFIAGSTYSNKLPFQEKWTPSLILYLNSLGTGECMKHAFTLSKTWEILGYKSRVWNLNGHVVSEVLFHEKWLMLDALYPLYFINDNNEIAGVEELMKNPDIITTKERIKLKYLSSYLKCLRDVKYYKTTDDNKIITDDMVAGGHDTFLLQLPPKSRLAFPGIFTKKIFSKDTLDIPYYEYCKLSIPPSYIGQIKNSFLMADIQGKGSLNINQKDYIIGSTELDSLINGNGSFIPDIYVTDLSDTLNIIYFINPIYARVKKEITLSLKGENIDSLQAEIIVLPDSLSAIYRLKNQYFKYHSLRMDFLADELSQYDSCIEKSEINSKAELIKLFSKYLKCIYNDEKEEYVQTVVNKIDKLMGELPTNASTSNLFFVLNYIPSEFLFYDLEHAPIDITYNFMNFLASKNLK